MPPLIKWSRRSGILIAMPVGRIDGTNYLECQNILESGIDPEEGALILDFARLGYISSAGLRVCLVIAKKFNEPGKAFGICNLSSSIRDIVTVSGFDQIIPLHESQGAAIEAITGVTGFESDRAATQAASTIPTKRAVNFDIVGENIRDIANFTIEKYEYKNDRTLSLQAREAAIAGITNSLWRFVERLRTRRQKILQEMFNSAEKALDEVIAKTD